MDGEFSSALMSDRVYACCRVMRVVTDMQSVSLFEGRATEHRCYWSRSHECSIFLASASR